MEGPPHIGDSFYSLIFSVEYGYIILKSVSLGVGKHSQCQFCGSVKILTDNVLVVMQDMRYHMNEESFDLHGIGSMIM